MRIVGIIQITEDKFLLLHRVKPHEDYFTFPGGAIEKGEDGVDALRREMQEELSISDIQVRKAFELTNRGNQEHWYYVDGYRGVPIISGPEKERMSEQNQYLIEYKSLEEMKALDNFFPKEAIEMIEKSLETESNP
ncbi:MAG: NUDIX domain-containing protein [Candidatus Paceibacterota bacterium]